MPSINTPFARRITAIRDLGSKCLEIKGAKTDTVEVNIEGYHPGTTGKAVEIDIDTNSTTTGCRGGALYIELDRQSTNALSSWDGNPDTGLKMVVNNRANNTSANGGTRALDIQARNRGTAQSWVKTVEINGRNDSGMTLGDGITVVHIRAENYGTLTSTCIGLDVELSNEGALPTTEVGIQIRNTDASLTNAAHSAIKITKSGTNVGFDYLIDASAADACNTAVFKFFDDGSVCDDTNSTGTQSMDGYLKVVVGTATRYIWLANNAPTA